MPGHRVLHLGITIRRRVFSHPPSTQVVARCGESGSNTCRSLRPTYCRPNGARRTLLLSQLPLHHGQNLRGITVCGGCQCRLFQARIPLAAPRAIACRATLGRHWRGISESLPPQSQPRRRPTCGLTPRSSGAPTAGHQAREALWLILRLAGLASSRCHPLSSNVRQRSCSQLAYRCSLGNSQPSLRRVHRVKDKDHSALQRLRRSYKTNEFRQYLLFKRGRQGARLWRGWQRRRAHRREPGCQARQPIKRLPAKSYWVSSNLVPASRRKRAFESRPARHHCPRLPARLLQQGAA